MAIPLLALYEISIVVCRISLRKRGEEENGGSEGIEEEDGGA